MRGVLVCGASGGGVGCGLVANDGVVEGVFAGLGSGGFVVGYEFGTVGVRHAVA
jgi:hypothetical protein